MLFRSDQGHLVNRIHEEGEIITEEYLGDGTAIHALVDEGLFAALKRYSVATA